MIAHGVDEQIRYLWAEIAALKEIIQQMQEQLGMLK